MGRTINVSSATRILRVATRNSHLQRCLPEVHVRIVYRKIYNWFELVDHGTYISILSRVFHYKTKPTIVRCCSFLVPECIEAQIIFHVVFHQSVGLLSIHISKTKKLSQRLSFRFNSNRGAADVY